MDKVLDKRLVKPMVLESANKEIRVEIWNLEDAQEAYDNATIPYQMRMAITEAFPDINMYSSADRITYDDKITKEVWEKTLQKTPYPGEKDVMPTFQNMVLARVDEIFPPYNPPYEDNVKCRLFCEATNWDKDVLYIVFLQEEKYAGTYIREITSMSFPQLAIAAKKKVGV